MADLGPGSVQYVAWTNKHIITQPRCDGCAGSVELIAGDVRLRLSPGEAQQLAIHLRQASNWVYGQEVERQCQ